MKLNGKLEEYVSLKDKNTYRIDTTTRYFYEPDSIEDLKSFLTFAKENHWEYFVIGNGSNLILSDTMYPGIVVKLDSNDFRDIKYNENKVTVGAGVMMNKLSYDILDHGLSGLEWASGIPGSMGGCIFGNAEAYNSETFDFLESVTYLTKDGECITKPKEELSHGYRTTWFKEHPENIIVSATFIFPYGNKEESLKLIKDRFERRKASQPIDKPSAGSVFRNPSPDMASWKLIDEVGLKGYRIGDAMVSDKHANFIVNMGHATGKDIKSLIKLIEEKVKKEKNIDLVLEQEIRNW